MVRGGALRRGFSSAKSGGDPPAGRTRPCKANVPKTHRFIRRCRLVCRRGLLLFLLGFLSRFLFLSLHFRFNGSDLVFLRLDRFCVFGDLSLRRGDFRLIILKLRLFCSQKFLHGCLFRLRLALKCQKFGMFPLQSLFLFRDLFLRCGIFIEFLPVIRGYLRDILRLVQKLRKRSRFHEKIHIAAVSLLIHIFYPKLHGFILAFLRLLRLR